jgi:hypothetical protein
MVSCGKTMLSRLLTGSSDVGGEPGDVDNDQPQAVSRLEDHVATTQLRADLISLANKSNQESPGVYITSIREEYVLRIPYVGMKQVLITSLTRVSCTLQ